ncbi:titin isoform X2 [Drosophila pseudoobscura]|uniref:Titin isoform X2 n=1 Tax=Drosophila pseudoobscura pseudoobscura TaxID=46245 RepID=A0A6I8VFC4_DROPS|nr:titin isoform X2 [Drosophila pseudoobscura]
MLGDDDIYGDLDDFQNAEEKKSKELQAWENKCKSAQAEIECLKVENKALNKKIKAMEVNLQNLMDTAKSEIKRKESMITQLRKEKDDICFRRKRGRADEDPKDTGHEYKRSKLSEPVSNKFKTVVGNDSKNTDHENQRPRLTEPVTNRFKTVVGTESKNTDHKRPKQLVEPVANKLKTDSKDPKRHKLEDSVYKLADTVTNKFKNDPNKIDKIHHQKSFTGGESKSHDNKDSKRKFRSRSPKEEHHRSSDTRLKDRERRRSRSRSAKRSHRHEHHGSRHSKERSGKRRSASRSPNRTASTKPSARQPDNDRSKRKQKDATVTTLFGEETDDQVLASPNYEMIKKMQANMSPATPVKLYTPENKLQAIAEDKPAKNADITDAVVEGYFQVNPLAKGCSLPFSQVAQETLEKVGPTAGVFSWASSLDKLQIPGLDMMCEQHSPIKNEIKLTEEQPEDLDTPKIDSIDDCIVDHTEEVITRPKEDCKPAKAIEEMEKMNENQYNAEVPDKNQESCLEAESIPEAPGKDEEIPMDIETLGINSTLKTELICESDSKDGENSMDIATSSINLTPESEEKEKTLSTMSVPPSAEVMEDAVEEATGEVTHNPPALEDFKTPTKCTDAILGDDCPTPIRPTMNAPLGDDCPIQVTEAIEIIEVIRLPVIVDIEHIALTVDVPYGLSEMNTDVSSKSPDLKVVDSKNENEEIPKKERRASVKIVKDMEIEKETVIHEVTAGGLEDDCPPIETTVIADPESEKDIPETEVSVNATVVIETPLNATPAIETPINTVLLPETPAIETNVSSTHGSENGTPEVKVPVIETTVTKTENETPAIEEPPVTETPVKETLVTDFPIIKTPVAVVYATNNETPVVEISAMETPEAPVSVLNEPKNESPVIGTTAVQSTGIEIPILPPHGSIHDSLIVAATSKPSNILYALPDSTKTDKSEDMVLEAAMNELTGEQEPVPSAHNTSYPNLTLAEDTIEMALQQLHQTSPDETKVTSTSNKAQKSPQKDLLQMLTESPLQLSPARSPTKGIKTTPMKTPDKLRVEKTPLKKRKIHLLADMQTDEVVVPQTPPPSQPPVALGNEASVTLQNVTIDETLDESFNRSFGSDTSVVTKRCSMGSTDYQFERINDEIVLRVSRRRRRPRPSPVPPDDGEKSAET